MSVDYADEAKTAAREGAAKLNSEAQRTFADARAKIEKAVQDGLEQLRTQSRVYADTAGETVDEAGRYVSERVRERPLAATGAAVGVGVLIGLLLAAGRR